jgi:hypothetical protein
MVILEGGGGGSHWLSAPVAAVLHDEDCRYPSIGGRCIHIKYIHEYNKKSAAAIVLQLHGAAQIRTYCGKSPGHNIRHGFTADY